MKEQHQSVKDHYWGFWKFNENQEAYDNACYTWNNWAVITSKSRNVLNSKKHPGSLQCKFTPKKVCERSYDQS